MRVTRALSLLTGLCFSTVTVDGWILKPPPPRPLLLGAPFCSRKCDGGAGRFASEMFLPYRCSCSRSCAVFGDCCYDSSYRNTELWQQYEFVCISVMGRSGYQAVSSCPPGFFTDHSRNCRGKLGLLPPVTSSQTNITYANLYCARCNGDADRLIHWNVDLSCPYATYDAIYGRFNRLEYSSHAFWMRNSMLRTKTLCKFRVRDGDFRTIDGLELRPCVTVNKISRCSPSWKDSAAAKKCSTYEDPVFLDNTAFRNPHCAHCNYVNLSYVECVPHHLKTAPLRRTVHDDVIRYCLTNSCHLDLGNGPSYSFGSVFNVVSSEIGCPKGERYDPMTCKCRPVRS